MSGQQTKSVVDAGALNIWSQLLKLGFGLLYNQMAWSYDVVSWMVSRGQWRTWQRSSIPYLAGELVLELAHGPGHMLLALQAAGFKVVGLDLSGAMIRLAGRRSKDASHLVSLIQGDGQKLPFRSGTFDSVLSTFPTEFLASQECINGIYRILKSGGRLVVVPQARLTGGGKISSFIEWLYAITGQRVPTSEDGNGGYWQVIGDRFHAAGFTLTISVVPLEGSEVTVVVAEKPADAE
jgi:ubiquinone/menaquinone biosynthesis C-methylase UbiE